MNTFVMMLSFCALLLCSACNTALDPSTERCNLGKDKLYCEDDVTVMECQPCRHENSSYSCWKQTGCYGEYRCRYIYVDKSKQITSAACILPDSEHYEFSFAEDPLP